MLLYRNRFRIASVRLPTWDYSAAGYYFVTICTRDRACCLGEMVDGVVVLSAAGEIVADEWLNTAHLRCDVTLDEWVIMPDHIHGIVCLHERTAVHGTCGSNQFGPQRNNLASIIRGFKSAATKRIRKTGHNFAWQPRFYDQIIRNDQTLADVREYIRTNPTRWTT